MGEPVDRDFDHDGRISPQTFINEADPESLDYNNDGWPNWRENYERVGVGAEAVLVGSDDAESYCRRLDRANFAQLEQPQTPLSSIVEQVSRSNFGLPDSSHFQGR